MLRILNALFLIAAVGCQSNQPWNCPGWSYMAEWDDLMGESRDEVYRAQGCKTLIGERNGWHVAWSKNGLKNHEGGFVNDKAEGEWRYYYPDGSLNQQGKFLNGLREGEWLVWDQEGRLVETHTFVNGAVTNTVSAVLPSGTTLESNEISY